MADAPSRRSTRFSMRSKQVGQLLQESGDVQAEQIAKALKIQEQKGGLIGQILQGMKAATPQAIAAALLKQVQVTDIHCEDLTVAADVLHLVPAVQCETDKLCPFERLGNLLCIVMGNPLNRRAINAIEEKTRLKVKPFKAPWPKIKDLVERSSAAAGSAPEQAEAAPAAGLEAPELDNLDAVPPMEIQPPQELAVDGELEPAPAEAEPAAPAGPAIEGLDNLNEENAEVIETDRRGLTRRLVKMNLEDVAAEAAAKSEKIAKVNVDLDHLDYSKASEVVGTADPDEHLEEISAEPVAKPARGAAAKPAAVIKPLAAIRIVADSYFYAEGAGPEEGAERSAEFLEALARLPLAEVVAESVADYRLSLRPKEEKPRAPDKPAVPAPAPALAVEASAPKPLPKTAVEYTAAPREPISAVTLSEDQFKSLVSSLDVDPVGEWDWKYAAAGPLPVTEYQTEAA